MKKFLLFIGFILFSTVLFAQERVVTLTMADNTTYKKYTGTTTDYLVPTTRDTIDVLFVYQGAGVIKKIALKSRFDMVTTADTTVAVSVFGKEFADDPTYVQVIGSTVSNVVTSNNVVQILSNDYYINTAAATDEFKPDSTITIAARIATPFDKSYKYFRVRYILSGNDSVGTGVKIDEIELKLYVD